MPIHRGELDCWTRHLLEHGIVPYGADRQGDEIGIKEGNRHGH